MPRKMGRVSDHLITIDNYSSKFNKLIDDEQKLLDVMEGQVKVANLNKTNNTDIIKEETSKSLTLLEAMGLIIEPTSDSDVLVIKKQLGEIADKYSNSYKIINKKTQTKFDNFISKITNKKTELFWHGSRNENWWSIIDTGLVLRPSNAVISGKMFGYNLYFADKARKSYGYTSGRGSYWARGNSDEAIMGLYRVHLGNQYHIYKHTSECYNLCDKKLKELGNYDSIYAHGGVDLRNDEFIIPLESQCTIEYLVELKG
jgi:poly [ADP-ribose] polymerase